VTGTVSRDYPLEEACQHANLVGLDLLTIAARDTSWDDTPSGWALVGSSGERPRHNPHADWVATVQSRLDASGIAVARHVAEVPRARP